MLLLLSVVLLAEVRLMVRATLALVLELVPVRQPLAEGLQQPLQD